MVGSEKKSRQIALAERGQCEFAIKAINAQAAGYKALIILDSKNDETDFSRYIMAIWAVEFSNGGYKIRKIFA